MGAEYRVEDLLAVWDEFLPLFRANYDAARDWHDIEHADRRETYEGIKQAGGIGFYTLRVDGQPAGYACHLIGPCPHTGVLSGYHDALYIAPEHRVGHRGAQLLAFAEEQLRAAGVRIVFQHTKPGRDHGALLQRLGYRPVETVYAKRLDGG